MRVYHKISIIVTYLLLIQKTQLFSIQYNRIPFGEIVWYKEDFFLFNLEIQSSSKDVENNIYKLDMNKKKVEIYFNEDQIFLSPVIFMVNFFK